MSQPAFLHAVFDVPAWAAAALTVWRLAPIEDLRMQVPQVQRIAYLGGLVIGSASDAMLGPSSF